MSERHVRAVQEQSQITDLSTRHILEIIALDIGYNDEPAYTSLRKIAERARCAVNTARNRVQKCIDSGELIATKDGKYTLYNLNPNRFLCPSTQPQRAHEKPKTEPGKGQFVTADTLIQLEKRLYQRQETLYQSLYQKQQELYQSLYQNIVSIVSVDQTGVKYKVEKVLEKGEVCRKDTHTHAETPKHFDGYNAMWGDGTPPDPNLLEFRKKVGEICRNGHKVDQVDDLYYLAVGYGILADDIERWFGPGSDYWYQVSSIGKRDGLPPYVKNIDGEMRGAQMWERAGSKMPALNGVAPHDFYDDTMPGPNEGGAW